MDPLSIQRQGLIERIAEHPHIRTVIVQAPAGHGKTTLLQQLAQSKRDNGDVTAWLTLDEADNDISRLAEHLEYLLGILRQQGVPDSRRGQVRSDPYKASFWVNRLNSHLPPAGQGIHLFLDDYQNIDDHGVHEIFQEIISHLPDHITVFIASRSIPPIGLSRLVVNQQALILRFEDLKFSPDEARTFFSIYSKLNLSEDELETVYQRSEGWPAALQLFRLTLPQHTVRDRLKKLGSYTPYQITEYLTSNVLEFQTERVKHFMLISSPLKRLCASLCNAVTGWEDSQSFLLFLERTGLFLTNMDQELHWFKFHGLFSHFLQEQLKSESPQQWQLVHRRAAQWFFDRELYEDSLYHAIEAEDYAFAVDAMDLWATEEVANACLQSVARWADKIPIDEIAHCPTLVVKVTWALTFLRRRDKLAPFLELLRNGKLQSREQRFQIDADIMISVVELVLDNLETAFHMISDIDTNVTEAKDFYAFELSAAGNIKAYHAMAVGDFAAARDFITIARNHSQEGKAIFPGGYNVGLNIISCYLQGRVAESLQRSDATLEDERWLVEGSYAAAPAVCTALMTLYENDQLDRVVDIFQQYRTEIDTGLMLDFVNCAYLAMIRACDARERFAESEQLLECLEDIAIHATWTRLSHICAWEHVRRALVRGDTGQAQAIASRIRNQATPSKQFLMFSDVVDGAKLSELRLLAYTDTSRKAEQALQAEYSTAVAQHYMPRQIKLKLFSAIYRERRGQHELAMQELIGAVNLSLHHGFYRTVIDEGRAITHLLQSALAEQLPKETHDFCVRLLAGAGLESMKANDLGSTGFQPLEPLTSRELQMLSLVARGSSNKVIARDLFISENTVKFHLKNIYSKLGVSTRTQAIRAAMNMGVI